VRKRYQEGQPPCNLKFRSNVMKKVLGRCNNHVQEVYLTELSDSERVRELMISTFDNYVIQRALATAIHIQAVKLVDSQVYRGLWFCYCCNICSCWKKRAIWDGIGGRDFVVIYGNETGATLNKV